MLRQMMLLPIFFSFIIQAPFMVLCIAGDNHCAVENSRLDACSAHRHCPDSPAPHQTNASAENGISRQHQDVSIDVSARLVTATAFHMIQHHAWFFADAVPAGESCLLTVTTRETGIPPPVMNDCPVHPPSRTTILLI